LVPVAALEWEQSAMATTIVRPPDHSRRLVFNVFGFKIASIVATQKLQVVDQVPEPIGDVAIRFKRQPS
jgi:hypothetical protein